MSKHWITGCAVVMVLFGAAPTNARAQEKYTIKLKEVGPGETLRAESRETTLSKNQTQMEKEKAPGKTMEEKTMKDLVFTETVLLRLLRACPLQGMHLLSPFFYRQTVLPALSILAVLLLL